MRSKLKMSIFIIRCDEVRKDWQPVLYKENRAYGLYMENEIQDCSLSLLTRTQALTSVATLKYEEIEDSPLIIIAPDELKDTF
jgi:hypothetical protein